MRYPLRKVAACCDLSSSIRVALSRLLRDTGFQPSRSTCWAAGVIRLQRSAQTLQ